MIGKEYCSIALQGVFKTSICHLKSWNIILVSCHFSLLSNLWPTVGRFNNKFMMVRFERVICKSKRLTNAGKTPPLPGSIFLPPGRPPWLPLFPWKGNPIRSWRMRTWPRGRRCGWPRPSWRPRCCRRPRREGPRCSLGLETEMVGSRSRRESCNYCKNLA